MKNKLILLIIYFLLLCNQSYADQYEFYARDLNASYSNNTIKPIKEQLFLKIKI